ncbi:hypothetical protein D1AOALGA4SA_9846 [Olavius algarvensis Delta 1 endosymbiont]|nr:hypothetical protein D1AOALGA4SA_9846 [Olavius algarvensis Delta 1 endosymbiont]
MPDYGSPLRCGRNGVNSRRVNIIRTSIPMAGPQKTPGEVLPNMYVLVKMN